MIEGLRPSRRSDFDAVDVHTEPEPEEVAPEAPPLAQLPKMQGADLDTLDL